MVDLLDEEAQASCKTLFANNLFENEQLQKGNLRHHGRQMELDHSNSLRWAFRTKYLLVPNRALNSLLVLLALALVQVASETDHILRAEATIATASSSSTNTRPDRVLELTSDNYDELTSKYQIVVLNFYADWCPYSARWKPVFRETALAIYNETQSIDPSTIVFGQINCEIQTTLSQRFRITKFPTTKLTLNGKPCKKEYRAARTAQAFREYVRQFLADPIVTIDEPHADLGAKVEERKGALIMYSGRPDELAAGSKPAESGELQMFRRVAQSLREDCQFVYVTSGAAHGRVQPPNLYKLTFKPHHKRPGQDELDYPAPLVDSATLGMWAKEHCIPLVREITFENAEELTEEGLPFVILFYDPNDKSWIELFKRVVESELKAEASGVTFLYADGHVFSHPLKHLGKTAKDLPVVAIDSFKHLFLYKQPVASISQPGMLKQFIADLHSGKLDREFHFGPDPVQPGSVATSPPESAFNKLQPSAHRYSLLVHDEL